ncbi:MAG: hypothetical protein JXB30_02370, partial [Anaerolineae bacterium]|nr:hypothetical protein [Anaerolineae bacterium]
PQRTPRAQRKKQKIASVIPTANFQSGNCCTQAKKDNLLLVPDHPELPSTTIPPNSASVSAFVPGIPS